MGCNCVRHIKDHRVAVKSGLRTSNPFYKPQVGFHWRDLERMCSTSTSFHERFEAFLPIKLQTSQCYFKTTKSVIINTLQEASLTYTQVYSAYTSKVPRKTVKVSGSRASHRLLSIPVFTIIYIQQYIYYITR